MVAPVTLLRGPLRSLSRLRVVHALAAAAALYTPAARAAAQTLVQRARPQIQAEGDFLAALDRVFRDGSEPEVEVALIASWGPPVTTWALRVAEDTTYSRDTRAAAVRVLGYARPREAMPVLQRLIGVSRLYDNDVWFQALYVLARYEYPELAPYWRSMLSHPYADFRESAIYGLSWTGIAADADLIAAARLDPGPRTAAIRDRAIARVRLPPEQRGSPIDAAALSPVDRFVPSTAWIQEHAAYLCRTRRLC